MQISRTSRSIVDIFLKTSISTKGKCDSDIAGPMKDRFTRYKTVFNLFLIDEQDFICYCILLNTHIPILPLFHLGKIMNPLRIFLNLTFIHLSSQLQLYDLPRLGDKNMEPQSLQWEQTFLDIVSI